MARFAPVVLVALAAMAQIGCNRATRGDDSAPAPTVQAEPPAATPTVLPPSAVPSAPSANPAAAGAMTPEQVMEAPQHMAAYQHPLLFHYAHIGGRGVPDLGGQLNHDDGRYFQLGPGDSLTLEAPEGSEFVSDGNAATPELEVIVHPHDRAARAFEVDVSHAHLDVNGPWVMLSGAGGHEIDLDHARVRSARYVRIRNTDPQSTVYLDAVYVRAMQPCTNPARCRAVVHRSVRR